MEFRQLGFAAPLNVYLGVFWWNQRIRVDSMVPSATVTFGGEFAPGDAAFVRIGVGTPELGKSVVAGEGPAEIARHFAYLINATVVGVYATASGNTLQLTTRSPKPNFAFEIESRVAPPTSSGTAQTTGSLLNGVWGRWAVDPSQGSLNRGARAWLADLFNECKARDREVTIASSMELVYPPEDFPARFFNQAAVETDVGFGFLKSTHCAFSTPMLNFHKALFLEISSMMSAALLTPNLQLSKASYPAARFEVLFPYDVNHPEPVGVHNLGGALNRFLNFPIEWQTKATSGLDRIKMEALNFGAWSRDLRLCRTAIEFPLALDWPLDSIRYLAPVFRAKAAWEKEYLMAKGLKIPVINFWAFDHVCLFGLETGEPQNRGRVMAD